MTTTALPITPARRARTVYVADDVWSEVDRVYSAERARLGPEARQKHELIEDLLRDGLQRVDQADVPAAPPRVPSPPAVRRSGGDEPNAIAQLRARTDPGRPAAIPGATDAGDPAAP